jgi:DNA-binding response OmpR family regulator
MSSRSVLIYERDQESGSFLCDLLASWGYQAIVADNLPAALKAVIEFKPALVVDGGSNDGDEGFALVRRFA